MEVKGQEGIGSERKGLEVPAEEWANKREDKGK